MATTQKLQLVVEAQNRANAALNAVRDGLDGVKTKVESLKPAFQKMSLIGTASFAAIGVGVKKAIENASDLGESVNAVNVVFGEGAESVLAFGETAARSIGLANAEFNQMSTQTGALLKDVGLPMEEVAQLTIDLSKRAGDMASVFNTDVSDAMSAINQAIRGETEAIRRYAGDVTDATLETYAMSKGIQTSVKDMTQQEKRLLRVQLIMEQTSVTQGDFANTSDSLANRQRILAAEFENISAKLGQAFIPIVERVLDTLGPLIDKFANWIEKNPELARNIIIATAAIAGLVAVVGVLGLILPAIITGFSLLLGPVGLVALAIAAVIAIGVKLAAHWDEIKAKAESVWSSVRDMFSSFADWFTQRWEAIKQFLTEAWENIKQGFADSINFIIGLWATMLDFLFPGWQEALTNIWEKGVEMFTAILNFLNKYFLEPLKKFWTDALGSVKNTWHSVWTAMSETFGEIWDAIKAKFDKGIEYLKQAISTVLGPLKTVIELTQKAFSLAKNAVGGAIESITNRGSQITGVDDAIITPRGDIIKTNPADYLIATKNPGALGGNGIVINIMNNDFFGDEGVDQKLGKAIMQALRQNIKL